MRKNILLVLSGGMDSVTALYQFQDQIGAAVSFNYGSKHNHKEIEMAAENCKILGVDHRVIDLGFINQHFKSDLLKSGGEIPEGHYAAENMKSTVVPFRNGIMLSISIGLAESLGLDSVMIANHAGDHTIYPDCRANFIHAMDVAAMAGTFEGISVLSPYCDITKDQIAKHGLEIGVPYHLTWSCYKGGDVHCGKCGTCVERIEALGEKDPTIYGESMPKSIEEMLPFELPKDTDFNPYINQTAEGKVLTFEGEEVINANELKVFLFNSPDQLITIETPEFQAVCPFSGLPDIAKITIEYKPKGGLALELKALKYYFGTFRNVGIYQEKATNRIFSDLKAILKTDSIKVTTNYNVRGGLYVQSSEGKI